MIQKIIRVGNSVAVTIPKSILEEAQLEVGSKARVEFDKKSKAVKVKPIFTASSEIHELTQKLIDQYRPALEELASK